MSQHPDEARHVVLLDHYSDRSNELIVDQLRAAEPGWRYESVPGGIKMGYRSRLGLCLLGWPRLLWFGLRHGLRVLRRGRPDTVVVCWSHLVLLPVAVAALAFRVRPALVLHGFIFTPRSSRLADGLRRWYFRTLLSRTDLVICHSRHECARYRELLGPRVHFVYAPFCLNVATVKNVADCGYAVSAGRSGRDYALLFKVFAGRETQLKVACDYLGDWEGPVPPNVEVLDRCYGQDYLQLLAGTRLVVIPLSVDGVSAGQMVLLQAMALGKPIIVTRTATTHEYITHRYNGYLVDMGDEAALRTAVDTMLADAALAGSLGANARQTYRRNHSITSEARHLVACLGQIGGRAGGPSPAHPPGPAGARAPVRSG